MFNRLIDHPQYIPIVQTIVRQEWNKYLIHEYGDAGLYTINPEQYFIVTQGTALVGFAAVYPCDLPSLYPQYSPWLTDVYVFPEYRRKQVASGLVNDICAQYPNELYLWCKVEMVSFYTALGWSVLHEAVYLGEEICVLVKR
jgi:GNAT superfamily N-acetyltransferase